MKSSWITFDIVRGFESYGMGLLVLMRIFGKLVDGEGKRELLSWGDRGLDGERG